MVGRHWEFVDGYGDIRRVEGEGVIGKQPLLFLRKNGTMGYADLGPHGDGHTFEGAPFVYQSQTGPVRGTSLTSTGQASISGTLSFVPGSIENPTGPLFHATVARFPLSTELPLY